MVIGIDQQAGFLDYEDFIKMKQMDPWRAEQFKKDSLLKFQKSGIVKRIEELKEEYYDNVESDPEHKDLYTKRFREAYVLIPMIDKFDEFKKDYETIKKQLEGIETLEEQLEAVSWPLDQTAPVTGEDELGSDEPDLATVEDPDVVQARMEKENADAVSERTETPEPTEDPVAPAEESIEDVRKAYALATGKEAPARYKNDIAWMKSKI